MWHEARKQEKLIRGMIVDYRRRAERRKDFYEKIKADPTQFLQIHGRPCKIHLDPAIAAAGDGPAIMMQWQGDPDNMIDRFDVRAHLDFIVETKYPDTPIEELSQEERQCNYERYRILAQNAFLGINEDKFLQQLAIEEQFGVTLEEKESQREKLHERKGTGAAIGYNYNDPGAQPSSSYNGSEVKKNEQKDSDEDSDLEILDVDLSIDVNKMEPSQAHGLNAVGPLFGMAGCDLFSFLTGDADDAEHQKQLLREEKEKAMYSGRKSRRERRAHRDKKLLTRVLSPPSYAAPQPRPKSRSRSRSRSPSPPPSPASKQIQFITSFGDDDDEPPRPLYSDKVKENLKRMELYSEVTRKTKTRSETSEETYSRPIGPRGPNSRSPSPRTLSSTSPTRSKSRSPYRSKSRSPYRRSKSRSRSNDSYRRTRSRSKSRSRSRNYRSRRSRSPNNSAKRNRSRSNSFESSERVAPSKPVPRYYGRRKEDHSSSELSLDSDSTEPDTLTNKSSVVNKPNTNPIPLRSSGSGPKGSSRDGISLKEKLRKKMQAQLARQLRLDKRVEAARVEREQRRQQRRDEEMRHLAIKLRRKQREMRHKHQRSSEDSDQSRSRSSSRDSGPPGTSDKLRSRSRSKSPEKRPPVWDKEPFHPKDPQRRRQEQNYPENNMRSRSPSPNYPAWENQRPFPPDQRKTFQGRSEQRYDSRNYQERPEQRFDSRPYDRPEQRFESRNYQERLDQAFEPNTYQERPEQRFESRSYQDRPDQRFESRNYRNDYDRSHEDRWDSRKPFRGGYRGHNRPGPSKYHREHDNSKDNKVKLVDY